MDNRTDLLSADEAGLAALAYLNGYKGLTRKSYEYGMRAWFGWCAERNLAVFDAKRVDIELYSHWMTTEKGYKPKTIDLRLTTVCAFYKSAIVDEYIDKDPGRYVRRPKVPTDSPTLGLSFLEFAMFLRAAEACGPNDYGLITLMGMLGLRISEAISIRLEDFTEERGHQVIRIMGKGSKPALVPLPIPVLRALEPLREGRDSGPLLRTRTGAPMTRSAGARTMARVSKRAGVTKHLSPHSLRHTFVTQLLDAGVDLRDVQIAARHATPAMTIRYDRARDNLDRHANYALASRMST